MNKSKLLLFTLSLLSLMSLKAYGTCSNKRAVILVPSGIELKTSDRSQSIGFSKAILQTVSRHACQMHVVKDVSSQLSLEENARNVLSEIQGWQEQRIDKQEVQLEVIAHGLGGLYALKAISLNMDQPTSLKFTVVNLISTPLKGFELATLLEKNPLIQRQLTKQTEDLYSGLALENLSQLTPPYLHQWLAHLNLPDELAIHSYAGGQTEAAPIDKHTDAQFLSPILAALGFLIEIENDGLVSKASAFYNLTTDDHHWRKFNNLKVHDEISLPLDHMEQVTEAGEHRRLGFSSTAYIEKEQILFFETLLQR